MTLERFRELSKLICDELNVHEFSVVICQTEKGELSICYGNNLGFDDKRSVYLKLGDRKVHNPKLLKATLNAMKWGSQEIRFTKD